MLPLVKKSCKEARSNLFLWVALLLAWSQVILRSPRTDSVLWFPTLHPVYLLFGVPSLIHLLDIPNHYSGVFSYTDVFSVQFRARIGCSANSNVRFPNCIVKVLTQMVIHVCYSPEENPFLTTKLQNNSFFPDSIWVLSIGHCADTVDWIVFTEIRVIGWSRFDTPHIYS